MNRHDVSRGFALLLVLWTLVVLSAVALSLAASVGTEVRASQELWNTLQAERLAKSGHDIAIYLETRAVGTSAEDLANLPVEVVVSGLKYRVSFDSGTVEILLEGENGRLDLSTATEDDLAAFFNEWSGDPNRAREVAASIADWVDSNDEPRSFGGESTWYLRQGYQPRNGGPGAADLPLVKGLRPEDFVPSMVNSQSSVEVRNSVTHFTTVLSTGRAVNPNYAPPLVLLSLPGMTRELLATIVQARQRSVFSSAEDLRNRLGLPQTSPLLNRFTFTRGTSPAVFAVARLHNSTRKTAERRARVQLIDRRRGVPVRVLALIEHTLLGE
jgi:general secretion pathway protein K